MTFNNIIKVTIGINLLLDSKLFISYDLKPVPINFVGKWAGMHLTNTGLTKSALEDLCVNGGDQKTSIFVDFSRDGQSLTILKYWEDSYI